MTDGKVCHRCKSQLSDIWNPIYPENTKVVYFCDACYDEWKNIIDDAACGLDLDSDPHACERVWDDKFTEFISSPAKPIHVNELTMADRIRELEERLAKAESVVAEASEYVRVKRETQTEGETDLNAWHAYRGLRNAVDNCGYEKFAEVGKPVVVKV